jgi:peptidoglycan/LPS O-acetylase OafA/YrhL
MSKRIDYFPQLDAVRAGAVMLTLLAHYLGRVGFVEIPYLWLGVDVFFVLSGFLITGILLSTKPAYPAGRRREIRNFFIRRVLRLFPAYYLLLIVFWAAFFFGLVFLWFFDYGPYFFLYVPNLFFFFNPEQASGSFNHMWSLGVEEQFYLIWPWIILYLPLRYMRGFLLLLIVLSLLLRISFFNVKNFTMLPFANFHTLAGGALLAYYFFVKPGATILRFAINYRQHLFFISFSMLVFILIALDTSVLKAFLSDVLVVASGVMLILCSAKGWSAPMSFVAENEAVQYIGRISYGIYLYHMPIPDTILAGAHFLGYQVSFEKHPWFWFTMFFVITFLVAHCSYHLIEKRFLKMKVKFAV